MSLSLYQVDAFAERPFEGNPAAVVPLESWLDDTVMQAIAAENNLAETAFFVPKGDGYHLRWFTPTVEIELCGHATLASAHVLFTHLGSERDEVTFETMSGPLTVARDGDLYAMNFPSQPARPTVVPEELHQLLGARASIVLKAKNWFMAVFEDMRQIAALQPDVAALTRFCNEKKASLIVTAPGDESLGWDFVSRFFAPNVGILEDPVTGGAHTTLIPYWAKRLEKADVTGRQISKRGGTLTCTDKGERVVIRGRAADYLKGEISF